MPVSSSIVSPGAGQATMTRIATMASPVCTGHGRGRESGGVE